VHVRRAGVVVQVVEHTLPPPEHTLGVLAAAVGQLVAERAVLDELEDEVCRRGARRGRTGGRGGRGSRARGWSPRCPCPPPRVSPSPLSGSTVDSYWDRPSVFVGIDRRLLPSAFAGIDRQLQGELC
jgi:hypothetical protein